MRALRTYALSFVLFALPFGVLTGLAFGRGPAAGVLAGLVGGALFSLIVGTIDLVRNRDLAPGRSTSPRQSVTVPVRPGWDLPHRIQGALQSLPAHLVDVDVPAGRYAARTSMSLSSWGEEVGVQLVGHPSAPSAVVTSRPTLSTTLLDFGRGRRNVDRVIAALQ